MKEIPLANGRGIALVDDADYEWLSQQKWHNHSNYAHNRKHGPMHRAIMNAPESAEVDHINRNRLDNQRANLRLVSRRENARNQSKPITRSGHPLTSRFKGVSWKATAKTWRAQITIRTNNNIRVIHLGYFNDQIEAANAYDRAARTHFGEFANTNFRKALQ